MDDKYIARVLKLFRSMSCGAACVMVLLLSPAIATAGGQNKLFDAKEAMRTYFWKEVYFAGGEALWCKTKFIDAGTRLTADYIFQVSWIKDHVGCSARAECEASRDYRRMTADLHNMYPAEKRVQLDRRNAQFEKVLQSDALPDPSCRYRIFANYIEPNNEIKGEVARAMLYMHTAYGLPVPGAIGMYVDWNNIDPPSAHEKQRNDLIMKIQGNRNPFIDSPKSAEALRAR